MATTRRINTIFQVRRGPSAEWDKVNPILRVGEPGFAVDTNEFRIGDGVTPWKDLNAANNTISVINRPTHYDFPSIGNPNVIYKAEQESKIYQWNSSTLVYEVISGGSEIQDIEIIHGGNANG